MTRPTDILEELVDQLTVPCPEMGPFGVVVHEPLLLRLREGISSSIGTRRGVSGPLSDGSVINLAAFDLYEDLEGRISVLTGVVAGLPEDRLRVWRLRFETARGRGEVTEAEWLTVVTVVGRWVRRIEDLFDPPMTREILAPCPACGARHIIDPGGLQQSAVFAEYRRGVELLAVCRACGTRWRGEAQLITLAHTINATVDVETLAQFRG